MQELLSQFDKAAHSYAVTLQYRLWDLFRDLGETDVGGTKKLESADAGDGENKVSKRKADNLARAYGWWIAKGVLSITVLKVRKHPVDTASSDCVV